MTNRKHVTKIWFELESHRTNRATITPEEGKALEDDYNAFFQRIGYPYDKVWWNAEDAMWHIVTGVDGSFYTTNMDSPGIWLNINALPLT